VRTFLAFVVIAYLSSTPWIPPSLLAGDIAEAEALVRAIRISDVSGVKAALQHGANPNRPDDEGDTPLMDAAVYSASGCMKLLLDRGADPNARDKRGGTALMRSVWDLEKVRLLLARGAEVDAASALGIRALMVAANRAGASDVVKLLLDRKADPRMADARGIVPLMYATESGDVKNVSALLAAGADVKGGRDSRRPAPIHIAAEGSVDVLQVLLEHGADPNATTGDGRTPLAVAAVAGIRENVEALLDRGADVNAMSTRGTPLMYAAGSDRAGVETIKVLLKYGADPKLAARRCDRCIHEPRADDGSMEVTALMLARQRGETEIVRLLMAAGAKR
jgi:ankyrin repeat protein